MVALKRTEAGKQEAEDGAQKELRSRVEIAATQKLQLQEEAQRFLARLGVGLVAWKERDLQWGREGMACPPEAWKGLPRVIYLLALFEHAEDALEHFEFAPDGPLWCKGCHEDEEMPGKWYSWECFDHVNAAVLAVNLGGLLFGKLEA